MQQMIFVTLVMNSSFDQYRYIFITLSSTILIFLVCCHHHSKRCRPNWPIWCRNSLSTNNNNWTMCVFYLPNQYRSCARTGDRNGIIETSRKIAEVVKNIKAETKKLGDSCRDPQLRDKFDLIWSVCLKKCFILFICIVFLLLQL